MTSLAEASIGTTTELAYIAGLCVSGILLIVLAALGLNKASSVARVGSGLVGVAMLGYGAYLFFGNPEHIWVFWYVFVVPVALVVQLFKHRRAANSAPTMPVYPAQQPYQNPQGQQPYQAYLNASHAPQNQYQAPQYQAPQYQAPQYQAPQYQDPNRPSPS